MLSPIRTSGAHICLRCQARAWQRWSRALPSQNHLTATLSTTSNRPQEAEQKQQVVVRRHYAADSPGLGKKRNVYKHINPRGRVRGKKGKEVFEDTATLEIQSLGKPSEVIVLKEAYIENENEQGKAPVEDQVSHRRSVAQTESQNILKSIGETTTAPTQDDINSSIEAVRQDAMGVVTGHYVEIPEARVEELRKKLSTSYSTKQLARYLRSIASPKHAPPATEDLPSCPEKAMARSSWKVGKHDPDEMLPPESLSPKKHKTLLQSIEKSLLSKNTVIRMILHEQWKVQMADKDGDLDLHLPSVQLATLLKAGPNPTALERISEEYSVSCTTVHRRVRIRGKFRAASAAADGIVNALASVKKRSLDLEGLHDWIAQRPQSTPSLSQPYFDSLLSHLRVAVDLESSSDPETVAANTVTAKQRLVLHAFQEADIDGAQQTLLQLMDIPRAGDCTRTVKCEHDAFTIPVDVSLGTAMRDHHLCHRRVAHGHNEAPTRSNVVPGEERRMSILDNKIEQQGYYVLSPQYPEEKPDELQWTTRSPRVAFATIGIAVSPNSFGKANAPKSSAPKSAASAVSEIEFEPTNRAGYFVPAAPHAFRWLSRHGKIKGHGMEPPSLSSSQLRFTYIPTPFASTKVLPIANYPLVQLVVSTDPHTEQQNLAHWIASLGKADFILPQPRMSLDLMFTKTCELTAQNIDGTALQECLQQVQASINDGGTLVAPKSIQINTPRMAFSRVDNDPWERPWEQYVWEREHDSNKPIDYLFAGTEYRQSVEMAWKPFTTAPNYRLIYTNITGGRLVGNRSELTLHPPDQIDAEQTREAAKQARQTFNEAAIELVRQISATGAAADALKPIQPASSSAM